MIRRLLVGLTGTPFTPVAIQRAIELSERHGAAVTGIAVCDRIAAANVAPLTMASQAAARQKRAERIELLETRVQESIEAFKEACETAGVPSRVVNVNGDPIQAVCAHWRYHDALVLGLRGLFDYGVFNEPQDALMQLIGSGVRPIIAVSQQFRSIDRVLIAYSGSLESAKAMKRFVQMRLWPDATVRVVHFGGGARQAERLLSDAQGYCRDWGIEAQTKHVAGSARNQLLLYAQRWNSDLVVLGNSARNVVSRRILGSTTYRVIRQSPLPLFLAH